MIKNILEKISQKEDLTQAEAYSIMLELMEGRLSDAQIAGLLIGLKTKGESVDEISGFVEALRKKAITLEAPSDVVDTCGTGGDGAGTFNISTAAAIVASAAGATVAKHGNRSVSSKCGSADVLAALGVKIDLSPEQAQQCLNTVGLAFLFAPVYHSSMKYAVAPRKELQVRTAFNILGPMANPALAKRQVIGAFNLETAEKMVNVLNKTGSQHVLVVHSDDGLDEISISGPTTIFELAAQKISSYKISPADFGLEIAPVTSLRGDTAEENATIIKDVLSGKPGPRRDVVVLNTAAALYVSGKCSSIAEGIQMAGGAIDDGRAAAKLEALIDFTQKAA